MTTRNAIDRHPEARTVSRKVGVYICPKCRRRVKRIKRPKRCCGEPLTLLGYVDETVNTNPREDTR